MLALREEWSSVTWHKTPKVVSPLGKPGILSRRNQLDHGAQPARIKSVESKASQARELGPSGPEIPL